MHKIHLKDGKSFDCEAHESLVGGAIRNGVFLDHSCLKGRCSSCKLKVTKGETQPLSGELGLSEQDKEEGYILSCVHKPGSALWIDAEDLSAYGISKYKTIPAKIQSIEKLTEDIVRIVLRTPPTIKKFFIEGQYLNVLWGGIKRSYSIASTSQDAMLELFIKNYKGGQMSAYWFGQAKPEDLLRLEIAHGTFFLRNQSDKDVLVLMATGTGIAPLKSILSSAQNRDKLKAFSRVILLWGMRTQNDIFWEPQSDEVEFIPVLSRETPEKRYVQDRLLELGLDFSRAVIYACGSNEMIEQTKGIALARNLAPNSFYSDAFVASD